MKCHEQTNPVGCKALVEAWQNCERDRTDRLTRMAQEERKRYEQLRAKAREQGKNGPAQ